MKLSPTASSPVSITIMVIAAVTLIWLTPSFCTKKAVTCELEHYGLEQGGAGLHP